MITPSILPSRAFRQWRPKFAGLRLGLNRPPRVFTGTSVQDSLLI